MLSVEPGLYFCLPDRTMYITTYQPGTIKKMMMDGTHGIEIVRGLNLPRGIAIDYSSSRLIWADQNTYKVQSSNLDGSNLQTVETFSRLDS